MTIPVKTLKNGYAFPVFGLGTWMMGGRSERDLQNNDERDIAAIRRAIDNGITHIDTAELYADGYAETLVGRAISDFDRSKLYLVSKVVGAHLAFDDVIKSAKASLNRLKTNYLDLYLIHWPNPEIPLKETMMAMDKLVSDGLVKNIGVSNFNVARMKEAQSYTTNKIIANQVHYNLIYREPEVKGVLQYCQDNDIYLIAWRPIEKGVLNTKNISLLDEMSKKYNKTPAQIAINWLISQQNVVSLSTMRSPEHLDENLQALNWALSEKDIERLRNDFPDRQFVSNRVPLQ